MNSLAIIGGRDFDNWNLLDSTIWLYFRARGQHDGTVTFDEVISGGARGADSLGALWARENGIPLREFLPDWDRYGKSAGFIRNKDIVNAADMVLAFWDSKSRGTADSLTHAKEMKKNTLIVYY